MTIEDINDPKWAAYDKKRPKKKEPEESIDSENPEKDKEKTEPEQELKLDDLKELAQQAGGLDKLILAAGWEISGCNMYEYGGGDIRSRINVITVRTPNGQEAYKIWPEVLVKNPNYNPNGPDNERYTKKSNGKSFMAHDKIIAENYLWELIRKYTKILDEHK